MQQIIEKYNSLEKLISKMKSIKNINIENETISKLYAYFNNKNIKGFLIKIFGKEKYESTLGNFKENEEDNEIIKADKLGKSNIKQYYSNINVLLSIFI